MRGNGSGAFAGPLPTEIEWQFDAVDLRPVHRWIAELASAEPTVPLPDATLVRNRGAGTPATAPLSRARSGHPSMVPFALDDASGAGAAHPADNGRHGSEEPSADARVAAAASAPTNLADTYYDTDDWRVGRAGFVLRLRRKPTGTEMTLKSLDSASAGLRRRIEITERLQGADRLHLGGGGEVGRRVRALVGRRLLHPVLEVRTRRHPFSLSLDHVRVGELVLDETSIAVGPGERPAQLRRVEVEVDESHVETLGPFVDRLRQDCALREASLTKFETGLLAAGIAIPGAPDLGPRRLPPAPTVGDVAYAVVRRNVAAMLAHEAGTRLGEDPEELHDMRVATRRLRAAFSLFDDVLPDEAAGLRQELGWLAGVLGTARDLDVQLEKLAVWRVDVPAEDAAALSELATVLEHERRRVDVDLLAALDSARFERLENGLVAFARCGLVRPGIGDEPAVVGGPVLIAPPHEAAGKAARRARRSGLPTDYHRLRIRCKRLRYTLEFFADALERHPDEYIRVIVRLQDMLGAMQDAEVATQRLHDLATGVDGPLPAGTVFAMGAIAQRYRQERAGILDALPARLKALRGGTYRRLTRRLDQLRQDVAARDERTTVATLPTIAPMSEHAPVAPPRGERLLELVPDPAGGLPTTTAPADQARDGSGSEEPPT